MWKEAAVAYLCLDELSNSTKIRSSERWLFLSRDSNKILFERKSEAVLLEQTGSIAEYGSLDII
jgi:hypothetical protein